MDVPLNWRLCWWPTVAIRDLLKMQPTIYQLDVLSAADALGIGRYTGGALTTVQVAAILAYVKRVP